ncbi:MAG: hypothetical protein AAGK57_04940, partial [Pseudomonadota bacterium]
MNWVSLGFDSGAAEGIAPAGGRARLSHGMFLLDGGVTALCHGARRLGIARPEPGLQMEPRAQMAQSRVLFERSMEAPRDGMPGWRRRPR